MHTSFNVITYEPYIALCESLAEILPHGEKTKALLVSTGAEAVENAVKIARQATKRQAILCYTGAFHGRTLMAMPLTSKIRLTDRAKDWISANRSKYSAQLAEDKREQLVISGSLTK